MEMTLKEKIDFLKMVADSKNEISEMYSDSYAKTGNIKDREMAIAYANESDGLLLAVILLTNDDELRQYYNYHRNAYKKHL